MFLVSLFLPTRKEFLPSFLPIEELVSTNHTLVLVGITESLELVSRVVVRGLLLAAFFLTLPAVHINHIFLLVLAAVKTLQTNVIVRRTLDATLYNHKYIFTRMFESRYQYGGGVLC